MKKIILLLALLTGLLSGYAQDEIKFSLLEINSPELTPEANKTINNRLSQVLNRLSAKWDGDLNVFQIVPEIEIAESAGTEGLIREVGRVAANLTLTAVNSVDGVNYCHITVPLSGSAVGGKDAAMKKMAMSLKPTDPVYVRFLRTARNKIKEYYTANCAVILQRGQLLLDTGRYQEAASYMSAVPAEVECFEQASELLRNIKDAIPETAPAPVPEPEPEPEPAPEQEEVPEVIPQPEPTPAPDPTPAPEPAYKPLPLPEPTVKVDSDDLFVRVVSCKGSEVNDRITIVLEVINMLNDRISCYTRFDNAFTSDGIELHNLYIKDKNGNGGYINLPDNLPVKVEIYISKVNPSVTELARLNLTIRSVGVRITDLSVQW